VVKKHTNQYHLKNKYQEQESTPHKNAGFLFLLLLKDIYNNHYYYDFKKSFTGTNKSFKTTISRDYE
jgi:hypothetical protein